MITMGDLKVGSERNDRKRPIWILFFTMFPGSIFANRAIFIPLFGSR